jgi:transposase InsO family protein
MFFGHQRSSKRPIHRYRFGYRFSCRNHFSSSLKKERIRKRVYKTRDLARADVFDDIEVFYYGTRRHSHLGGVSPEAFEQASL